MEWESKEIPSQPAPRFIFLVPTTLTASSPIPSHSQGSQQGGEVVMGTIPRCSGRSTAKFLLQLLQHVDTDPCAQGLQSSTAEAVLFIFALKRQTLVSFSIYPPYAGHNAKTISPCYYHCKEQHTETTTCWSGTEKCTGMQHFRWEPQQQEAETLACSVPLRGCLTCSRAHQLSSHTHRLKLAAMSS